MKKEVAEAKRAHGQLDVEVKEIYNVRGPALDGLFILDTPVAQAVNAELDSMFDDSRLPVDERLAALQREIKRRTADEVLLRYRIACVARLFATRRDPLSAHRQLEAANAPAPS